MAVNPRTIRGRIKSVKNTRKITKAMELVAASKMRRAVSSLLGTRPYAGLAWETVRSVAKITDPSMHPLLAPRKEINKVLFVLITSDRGLCGGFNARMLKEAMKTLATYGSTAVEVITVGKRGADTMRRVGKPIVASFVDLTNNPKYSDIRPIARLVLEEYQKGTYDKVVMGYTDYISALTQVPNLVQLLPLTTIDISEPTTKHEEVTTTEYVFEPSPMEVLDALLPKIVETKVWQALLESAASEHSARMMAMRNASEAAGDMIDSLTFTFNQARQAGITREIAEISSGKAALE
ncbi:MAG: ATP synthase F1 subunit gamma [Patescibacteria group bacterium]